MACLKLLVTKIKCSKGLQSQRTECEIKTSFDFTVNICKYESKNKIKSCIHPPFIATNYSRQKITFFRYSWLIQIAYEVHMHTQLNMIEKQ